MLFALYRVASDSETTVSTPHNKSTEVLADGHQILSISRKASGYCLLAGRRAHLCSCRAAIWQAASLGGLHFYEIWHAFSCRVFPCGDHFGLLEERSVDEAGFHVHGHD